MGCDAYADENGEVEIKIFSYDEPNNSWKQATLTMGGLEPNERLQIDWNKGSPR